MFQWKPSGQLQVASSWWHWGCLITCSLDFGFHRRTEGERKRETPLGKEPGEEVQKGTDICFSFLTIETNPYSLASLCPGYGRGLLQVWSLCQQLVQTGPESPVIWRSRRGPIAICGSVQWGSHFTVRTTPPTWDMIPAASAQRALIWCGAD